MIDAGGLGCRVSLDELVQVDEALVAEHAVVEQGQDVGDLRIVEGEEFFRGADHTVELRLLGVLSERQAVRRDLVDRRGRNGGDGDGVQRFIK